MVNRAGGLDFSRSSLPSLSYSLSSCFSSRLLSLRFASLDGSSFSFLDIVVGRERLSDLFHQHQLSRAFPRRTCLALDCNADTDLTNRVAWPWRAMLRNSRVPARSYPVLTRWLSTNQQVDALLPSRFAATASSLTAVSVRAVHPFRSLLLGLLGSPVFLSYLRHAKMVAVLGFAESVELRGGALSRWKFHDLFATLVSVRTRFFDC